LPLACDPKLHKKEVRNRDIDVGFVGKLGALGTRRRETLSVVLTAFSGNNINRFYSPEEMAVTYSRSKVVINAAINGDLNMRVFEAMASGALLVTDRIENGLGELFRDGEHYVGYSTANEAVEKIRYYLAHQAERERIAWAAREEVLLHHAYSQRLEEIVSHAALMRNKAAVRHGDRQSLSRRYNSIVNSHGSFSDAMRNNATYGVSGTALTATIRAAMRTINRRVPITPGAFKIALSGRFSPAKRVIRPNASEYESEN
jgi:hypothetical protein